MDWIQYAWSWIWPTFDSAKLKMLIKTAVIRINIHKKKTEEEISKLKLNGLEDIKEGKEDTCRIKIESILLNEKKVSVYAILLLLCETLLSRLSLLDSFIEIPGELSEAISTLIYAAPRCGVEELQQASYQFLLKYGSAFVDDASNNKFFQVNPKVVDGLNVAIPSEEMIRDYLRALYAKGDLSCNAGSFTPHYNTYTAQYIPSAPSSTPFIPPENPEYHNGFNNVATTNIELQPANAAHSTLNNSPAANTLTDRSTIKTERKDTHPFYPDLGPLYKKAKMDQPPEAQSDQRNSYDKQHTECQPQLQQDDEEESWRSLQARLEALRDRHS
jgi:vacuolar protein sorting-associated protein IST1